MLFSLPDKVELEGQVGIRGVCVYVCGCARARTTKAAPGRLRLLTYPSAFGRHLRLTFPRVLPAELGAPGASCTAPCVCHPSSRAPIGSEPTLMTIKSHAGRQRGVLVS
jgi:hypothetical protein